MRRTGSVSLLCAVVLYAGSRFVRRFGFDERLFGVELEPLTLLGLTLASVVLAFYGSYTICRTYLVTHTQNKRRQHDV
jgi:hypothetical protein